jgi:putative transposase
MARRPRLELPGHALHIIQRGNNRTACFYAADDYRLYLDCLADAAATHGCLVHAYVLMTNHVHLLATPQKPCAASGMMQHLGRRYVRIVNDRRGRTGTMWEGRFKATLVDSDQYLLTCHRYIELNPVRAGVTAKPHEYPWSSHRHYAQGRTDPLLTEHEPYARLGRTPIARQEAFRALFRDQLDDAALAEIRSTVNRGWPIGSERFKNEIEQVLRRAARPPKRGRPASPKTDREIRIENLNRPFE